MKAFRNMGGVVVEIDVDVDPNGQPLLPPDTTVDPRPEPQPGHYVTVVGHEWVQIPIPEQWTEFSELKSQALERLSKYKNWYLDQPVEVNGRMFDADGQARIRLTQTLVIYNATNYLPPAWIDYNNQPYAISKIADLMQIITAVQTAFSTRFYEMDQIRQQILSAQDEEALQAVEIPALPTFI